MNKPFFYPQPMIPGANNIAPTTKSPTAKGSIHNSGQSADFQKILDQEAGKLKFSSHAQQRLNQRNIHFGEKELKQLNEAVQKAESKGAQEALVMMKDLALVVSIKNRTVITAAHGNQLKDNVFTKIDSAVIIPS
ncbi:flagellar biosynthesis protein [Heliorestis acidaminivorans]|uniref:Flagellar biosynthesis protein n=1 Tax=Heliorestis acidaminivorans TaxID=553427 RepID=A0A6I0F5Z3_9FIRM|nr:TIGR02530 family flagellar biosynthesis protein [Heliorestis acidaminivorans]KAB2954392.1 flagellar biosynthesis protein [Heliorestis acidaminivorans]